MAVFLYVNAVAENLLALCAFAAVPLLMIESLKFSLSSEFGRSPVGPVVPSSIVML